MPLTLRPLRRISQLLSEESRFLLDLLQALKVSTVGACHHGRHSSSWLQPLTLLTLLGLCLTLLVFLIIVFIKDYSRRGFDCSWFFQNFRLVPHVVWKLLWLAILTKVIIVGFWHDVKFLFILFRNAFSVRAIPVDLNLLLWCTRKYLWFLFCLIYPCLLARLSPTKLFFIDQFSWNLLWTLVIKRVLVPVDETKIILLLYFIANIIFLIDVEASVRQSIVSLRALQVPELVKESIIAFLLECFHDCVQILLGLEPLHFLVRI